MERKFRPRVKYLYTDARVACFVEGWSVGEIVPTGNSIKHQAPLIQGRRGVLEEVV